MPRKSRLELNTIDLDVLKKTYLKTKTIYKTAKKLNLPFSTARRYLIRLGVKPNKPGHPKDLPSRHYSSLIKWVREHPTTPLPRSVKAITALTLCTEDAVKTYLYRRRRKHRQLISKLPDLRETNCKFKLKNGVAVPFRFVKDYDISFDQWNFQTKLTVRLKPDGKRSYTFKMNKIEDLIKFIERSGR